MSDGFYVCLQPAACKLFEIERELKKEVAIWQSEKEDRIDRLSSLKKMEQTLCDIMAVTPMYIASDCVPTKQQLNDLQEHTDKLASEKVRSSLAALFHVPGSFLLSEIY